MKGVLWKAILQSPYILLLDMPRQQGLDHCLTKPFLRTAFAMVTLKGWGNISFQTKSEFVFIYYKSSGFPQLSIPYLWYKPNALIRSNGGSSVWPLWDLGSIGSQCQHDAHAICCAISNEISDPRVSCLLAVSIIGTG